MRKSWPTNLVGNLLRRTITPSYILLHAQYTRLDQLRTAYLRIQDIPSFVFLTRQGAAAKLECTCKEFAVDSAVVAAVAVMKNRSYTMTRFSKLRYTGLVELQL